MAQKNDNIPLITLDDAYENAVEPTRMPDLSSIDYKDITEAQQVEETFEKVQYLTVKTTEALNSSTGVSVVQVQKQKLQQKNKIVVKTPHTPSGKQDTKPARIRLISYGEFIRKTSILKKELDSEKIKSSGLREQLHDLRSQYDNLIFEKNKMAQELEEGRLMISQLDDKIRTLTESNEIFKKHLNDIAAHLKKLVL